jgi:hypothetical protein
MSRSLKVLFYIFQGKHHSIPPNLLTNELMDTVAYMKITVERKSLKVMEYAVP